jgi:serine/threonine-protein phosphatase PGAM5
MAFSQPSEWNSNWDGLEGKKSNKSKKTRTLILVRHGQYEMAEDDKGRVLSELGKKQAANTGNRLASLLTQNSALFPPLENVVYSTMTRATETHDIILNELSSASLPNKIQLPSNGSQPCDLIREGAVCRPIPDTWRDPTDKEFIEDNARIEKAFQKYFYRNIHSSTQIENITKNTNNNNNHDSRSTLFVCHGNVIRYFVMRALQLPPDAWLRTSVANASITVISIHPSGRVSLQCMGDTGHLHPSEITFN